MHLYVLIRPNFNANNRKEELVFGQTTEVYYLSGEKVLFFRVNRSGQFTIHFSSPNSSDLTNINAFVYDKETNSSLEGNWFYGLYGFIRVLDEGNYELRVTANENTEFEYCAQFG